MTENINQNPEQKARDNIDKMLVETGWVVQSKKKVDLSAAKGVAVREYQSAGVRQKNDSLCRFSIESISATS